MSTKFAPRLRARAIWKSKSLKTDGLGALLEVQVGKICTAPARESDLEVKIVKSWEVRRAFGNSSRQNLHHACARESDLEVKMVKNWDVRRAFGSWSRQNLHHACARGRFGFQNRGKLRVSEDFFVRKICTAPARERDLEANIVKAPGSRGTFLEVQSSFRVAGAMIDRLQNTWRAQEFVKVAKTLAGVVDLKRVRNDAFRVAGARISWSVMSMSETSDVESVEGLLISCHGNVTLQGPFRVAVTGARMRRLNFFAAGAVLLKRSLKNRYNVLEFSGVSGRHVIFEGRLAKTRFSVSIFFEESVAKTLRFSASKFDFWRKSRRKASFLSLNASQLVS